MLLVWQGLSQARQGSRLKPVGGPGRDLRRSRSRTVPNRSRLSRAPLPGPFLPLMIDTIAAGDQVAAAGAGVGGDEYVNAK